MPALVPPATPAVVDERRNCQSPGVRPATDLGPEVLAFVVSTTGSRPDELAAALDSVDRHAPEAQRVLVLQRVSSVFEAALSGRPGWEVVVDHGVGSCRARNAGLDRVTRPWVQFVDDDAELLPWWRADIERLSPDAPFGAGQVMQELVAIAMPMRDAATGATLIPFPDRPVEVTRRNVWRTVIEPTVVLRADALREIGGWEETLGVGVRFESEEGIDLVVRLLDHGWRARFVPVLASWHPTPTVTDPSKKRRYGRGTGRLVRLHSRSAWMWFYALGSLVAPVVVPYRRGMDRSRFVGRWMRSIGIAEGLVAGGPRRLPRRLGTFGGQG